MASSWQDMTPTRCAVCGKPDASPRHGHRIPFCAEDYERWMASPERAEAATARERFARRMRALSRVKLTP